MLLDPAAEICAYVAKDTVKGRRLVSEAMKDYRSGASDVAPHRLRIFWVPNDFDADDESQRQFVAELLRDAANRDILMNVVFGNLTAGDVRAFVRTSGHPGLHLAVLYLISVSQDSRIGTVDLANLLQVSSGAVRERLLRLAGCGFLRQFGGVVTPTEVTLKGRVFLDLCGQLKKQVSKQVSTEMLQILRLLDMRYAPSAVRVSAESLQSAGPLLTEVPEMVTGRLLATIGAAVDRWGIDFDEIPHVIRPRGGMDLSGAAEFIENLRIESSQYSS
jgi:DNA-binding Lrp family transcriptional regulator